MGQRVVAIVNNLDGLHVEGRSYPAGAKFSVAAGIPAKLVDKIKEDLSFHNGKKRAHVFSFILADGTIVDEMSEVYVPELGIGNPPIPPVISETDVEPRSLSSDSDEDKDDVSSDNESPEDSEPKSPPVGTPSRIVNLPGRSK